MVRVSTPSCAVPSLNSPRPGVIVLRRPSRHEPDPASAGKARPPTAPHPSTLPVMAGNPPAEASQPSGIKGIIVTVVKKVTAEPAAPRIPSRLSQKPANSNAPKIHSKVPRNQLAPRMPNTGYNHEISGPLLMNGTSLSASYSHHF